MKEEQESILSEDYELGNSGLAQHQILESNFVRFVSTEGTTERDNRVDFHMP